MKRFAEALLVAACVMSAIVLAAGPARAAECPGLNACVSSGGGVRFEVERVRVGQGGGAGGPGPVAGYSPRRPGPASQSTITPGCPGNDPNTGTGAYDYACPYLSGYCVTSGQPGGSLTWLWRRPVDRAGTPAGPWVRVWASCNIPAPVLTAAAGPGLTRPLLERAFRDLPLARPVLAIQPVGGVTLVNLPTYYQVRWPGPGNRPGQVATTTLLGRVVHLKPAATFTYRFGDAHQFGPTPDPGGPYPTGQITHTYPRPATVQVTATATYTGQYSLDGTTWQNLNLTIPITGPPTPLQIRQARARLTATPHQR